MALTGMPIHAADALKLNLVDTIVNNPAEFEMELSDIVSQQEPEKIIASDVFESAGTSRLNPWQESLKERSKRRSPRLTDA